MKPLDSLFELNRKLITSNLALKKTMSMVLTSVQDFKWAHEFEERRRKILKASEELLNTSAAPPKIVGTGTAVRRGRNNENFFSVRNRPNNTEDNKRNSANSANAYKQRRNGAEPGADATCNKRSTTQKANLKTMQEEAS